MCAARLANLTRGGDRSKPSIDGLVSQESAAKLFNVSVPSVGRAKAVLEHGVPELQAAVQSRGATGRATPRSCVLWQRRASFSTEGLHFRVNQLARRNLTPFQRVELVPKMEPLIAAKAKAQQGTRTDLPQNSAKGLKPVETRRVLAKAARVSHDTIAKVKVISKKADEKTKERLRAGDVSMGATSQAAPRSSILGERRASFSAAALEKGRPRPSRAAAGAIQNTEVFTRQRGSHGSATCAL